MPRAKDSLQVNVTVSKADRAIADKMRERAESLGPRWSLAGYGLEIWRWWHLQGCPAVNAQDQAMILSKQMAATKRAK